MATTATRSLAAIAADIRADWGKAKGGVHYAAKPYLDALFSLDSIHDDYYADSGRSVVLYFLSNARSWTGPVAKAIKAELKTLAGLK